MTASTSAAAGERAAAWRPRAEQVVGGVLAAWMVGVLAVFWPALRLPVFVSDSSVDASFFGYAGELVRRGGLPYVTFWDHKPPLIFYINALALTLSGGAVWGLWIAALVTVLAAMWLGYRAMRTALGADAAMLGLVAFVVALSRVLPVNMTEGYVLPVLWATALVAIGAAASGRLAARPFLTGLAIGALGATAFFIRANTIGTAAATALALSVALLAEQRIAAWLRFALGGVVGAAAVGAVVLAPFVAAGALGPLWDQAFHYNFLYARSPLGLRVRVGATVPLDVFAYGTLLVPIVGWMAAAADAWTDRRRGARLVPSLLLVIWLPIELALATTSGRPYGHYFAVAMPAVAYATAYAAAALLTQLAAFGRPATRWGRRAVAALAVAMLAPAMIGTAIRLRDREPPRARYDQVAAASALIRASTPLDGATLVWGHASDVYFMADRRPATRFVYPLALLTPAYADPALVRGFIDEVRAAAPAVIIDATSGRDVGETLVPSLDRWDPTWRYPAGAGEGATYWSMTPALREFYDYVHRSYVRAGVVGPLRWSVYRRASP